MRQCLPSMKWFAYAQGIQADVLKAGHHGSKTSSSAYFLAAVQPSIAVISAGKDNSYGHPHQNVIESIAAAGAQILNTADNGTIILERKWSSFEGSESDESCQTD